MNATAVSSAANPPALAPDSLDYLSVDAFMRDVIDAGALRTAFELRLIDALADRGPTAFSALVRQSGSDPQGLRFLLGLLRANRVVEALDDDRVALHPAFARALRFRELIEAKLEHAAFMLADFGSLFTAMVANPQRYLRHARVFRLFDYARCFDATPSNLRHTAAWMRLTTALTRHEAPPLLQLHDLGSHSRLLDVGGNSGEFALQACRAHPRLRATVADLPVVCELGLEHVLPEPERDRIRFLPLDLRRAALPTGHDLVVFKSMLHDWPDDDATAFLRKGAEALAPGGTLLVYERGPLDMQQGGTPPFSMLPLLMFFRSYRLPDLYLRTLRALGLQEVRCLQLRLDTPFFLVSARKPR